TVTGNDCCGLSVIGVMLGDPKTAVDGPTWVRGSATRSSSATGNRGSEMFVGSGAIDASGFGTAFACTHAVSAKDSTPAIAMKVRRRDIRSLVLVTEKGGSWVRSWLG